MSNRNCSLGVVYALTDHCWSDRAWNYYILDSVIEVGLWAAVVYYGWTRPN